MIRVTERTIYEHLTNFLREHLNAKTVQEVRVGAGFVDILFQLDSTSFITEVKIGGEKEFAKAIAQVYEYAMQYGTRNVLVLVYPQRWRGLTVLDLARLPESILTEKIMGRIYTDYWTEWIDKSEVNKVFEELGRRFSEKDRKIDFNSVVSAIRENVSDLHSVIRQAKTKEVFEEVAEKLELFVGLGEIRDRKKAEAQVSMLASYLLFNQILFYHVYRTKTNDKDLHDLKTVKSLKELESYFERITQIDYQPIYSIKLVDKIPDRSEVLKIINDTTKNLVLLRTEHITQDLAGRFFHALLPHEVAKVWAAFYTNPIAAEILAQLAVETWEETALDPACGSGTLLSAVYRKKLELFKDRDQRGSDENVIKNLHKRFLEEDITGIDIMPFASHLTAINLSLQKLEVPTNVVRIAHMDSLELAPKSLTSEFKEKGILLKPFSEEAQLTLSGEKRSISRRGTASSTGIGKPFYLKPVDLVIMNPPFSDRNKLPSYYREKLNNMGILGKKCGHQVNLWGYFLVLADLFLRPNGKIAAVVPINLARGGATEKIRNFLIDNYYIKYIVKPVADLAFSESAAFRDILLIAEKRRPKKTDVTNIMFLKKSIREMRENDVSNVVNLDLDYIDFKEVTNDKILRNRKNLMPLLVSESIQKIFEEFAAWSRLTTFNSKWIDIGLPFRPIGVADGVFITNNLEKSRTKNAFAIVSDVHPREIAIFLKGVPENVEEQKLDKENLAFALRTNTGVKKVSVNQDELDFVLTKKNDKYLHSIRNFNTKIPIPFPWKEHQENNVVKNGFHLVIPRKIRLDSPNTHVISAFSERELRSAGPSLWYFKDGEYTHDELKILNLFLNSILTIIQIILYKSETLGAAYFELMKSDWSLFKILDLGKLKKEEKDSLLALYKKISKVEFPSIVEQLEKRFWARVELDRSILGFFGLSRARIDQFLPEIYDAIINELRGPKEVK
jgi:type I restriction-modification system DNA methylase subunit